MGAGKKLKIGTRGSPLALAQTRGFIESLKERHTSLECEIVTIQTSGDRVQDRFWSAAGGKGLFTKEIEEALLRNEIDLAVHSLKDLPAVIPDGLTIACLPKRLTYEDVLLTRDGSDLNGRDRRDRQPAAARAAEAPAPRSELRPAARQHRHADQEAEGRGIRRHRFGQGRDDSPGFKRAGGSGRDASRSGPRMLMY
jgi:hypothetical protein